jgi:ABC-type Fe3+-hydroxamate transport system substrate-binding protein
VRVVSLVPSSTETLLALGADVVACTRFCEQPTLPHVGGTKNPDLDAIAALVPDLVVLDREENRLEDHDALIAAGCAVFVSDVTDVESALAVVDQLAAATAVAVELETHPRRLLPRATPTKRLRAFVPIWRRPWMTISESTYGASVLDHIGIELVRYGPDGRYPTVTLDEVATATPDLVLVPSEPYEFDAAHLAELEEAFPGARVVRIDGQDLFWWGSRTRAAISRLAAALALPAQP